MCDYAQVLLDAGDNDKAKKVLLGAVREFPDDLRARHLLAKSFIRLGEYSSAGTSLRKALAISPGNPEVLRDLAYVQQIRKKGWAAQRALLGAGKR